MNILEIDLNNDTFFQLNIRTDTNYENAARNATAYRTIRSYKIENENDIFNGLCVFEKFLINKINYYKNTLYHQIKLINLDKCYRHLIYLFLSKWNVEWFKEYISLNSITEIKTNIIVDVKDSLWTARRYIYRNFTPFFTTNLERIEQFWDQTNIVSTENVQGYVNEPPSYQKCRISFNDYILYHTILIDPIYSVSRIKIIEHNNFNKKIKYEIADILFDLKEKLTDNEYKILMEKTSQIKH
jgi:hypothetical protein